jgi:hypothetical protein
MLERARLHTGVPRHAREAEAFIDLSAATEEPALAEVRSKRQRAKSA